MGTKADAVLEVVADGCHASRSQRAAKNDPLERRIPKAVSDPDANKPG